MNDEPISHREVISKLGGPTAVARDLGLPTSRVQQMSNRDSISYWYWPAFEELAKFKGLSSVTEATLKAGARTVRAHGRYESIRVGEVAA